MLRTFLEDIAFVAYAVPAKRLEPLMTSKLTLDLQPGTGGDQAFLATVCCRYRTRAFSLAPFRTKTEPRDPGAGDRIIQAATYFTYVKREDAPSVYLFRTVIDPPFLGSLAQLLVPSVGPASAGAGRSTHGRLRTDRYRGADVPPRPSGWIRYLLSAPDGGLEIELGPLDPGASTPPAPDALKPRSAGVIPVSPAPSPAGPSPSVPSPSVPSPAIPAPGMPLADSPAAVSASAVSPSATGVPAEDGPLKEGAPAGSTEAAPLSASFLTQRPRLHFWIRGRYLWKIPVSYREPVLYPAVTGRIRIPLWQEMGLLSAAEIETPAAAFLCPGVSVDWMAPRPDISM